MPSAKEMRSIARDLKIRGYSKMNKAQLEEACEAHLAAMEQELPAPAPASDSKQEQPKQEAVKSEAPKQEVSDEPPAHLKPKTPKKSAWIDHCKAYAKEHNVSYKVATLEGRESYHAAKKAKAEAK